MTDEPMTDVTTTHDVDLAIIGAGPTGLFAAYYAGFRGLSVAIIDSLSEAGGQVTAMYPEKLIFDVAGFPSIRGRDLVERLVEQADAFTPTYRLGALAEGLTYVDDKPVLTLSNGETWRCGAVLITAGLGNFTARPLPAAAEFPGDGIVYFVPHLADLAGHHVVIAGGGDSAFDWASSLSGVAEVGHARAPPRPLPRARVHRDGGPGDAGRDHRERGDHPDRRRRRSGQRRGDRGKGPGRAVAAGDHDRGGARVHRRPRSARRLGARRSTSGTSSSTPRCARTARGSSRPATSANTPARCG